MLGSVIRNTAVFIGVVVAAVILLRDNTTFFTPGTMATRTAPAAHRDLRPDQNRQMAEEESEQNAPEPPEEEEPRATEEEPEAKAAERREPDPEIPQKITGQQSIPDEMIIRAGPNGHFFVRADIDGNDVGFMVDTGASMVALSIADAETLGYSARDLNYTGRANTANGVARYAPIVLSEITIGDITIQDVQAVVMEAPMNISLLGMTFLRRLEGFEIKDDHLIMRW